MLHPQLPPIFHRRNGIVFLKELTESGLIGEMKFFSDLTD